MITLDDIATVITSQLEAQGNFATVLPGDCFYDRADDTPASYPYGVFTIKAALPSLSFEGAYCQTFQVQFAAYCPPQALTEETTNTVREFFFSTFATEDANTALKSTGLRNPTERILHSKPQPETGTFAQTLREGRDIFITGLTIEILAQGDRSVS